MAGKSKRDVEELQVIVATKPGLQEKMKENLEILGIDIWGEGKEDHEEGTQTIGRCE